MDKYKTRYGNDWRITMRGCEVDFSKSISGYEADGFKVYKGLMGGDAVNAVESLSSEDSRDVYFNYEADGSTVRSILGVHRLIDILKLVPSEILDDVRSILGGDFYIHQSRINVKLAGVSSGWTPHSDFETWHYDDGMENMRCLTLMIPLDDNVIENGCLNVVKGSHFHYFSDRQSDQFSADENFTDQKSGVVNEEACAKISELCGNDWEPVELSIGDALIFDCNLLHKSDENKSSKNRTNLFFVLNSVENKLKAPFSGAKPRPAEMAER